MVEAAITEAPKIRPDFRLFLFADSTGRSPQLTTSAEYRVLRQPATLWFDQVELPRALTKEGIDVFWSPYYKAPIWSPCPTAITIHDIICLKIGGGSLKNALFKPWARLISSRTTRVLTDSEHSRRDLETKLGVDPSRIEVVPLGVSDQFAPSARSRSVSLLARLGIPGRYILTVTNFRPHKNDDLLIRAFAHLAKSDPDLVLVLAGRPAGPTRELRDAVEQMELRDRVFFPGLIAEEELPALYANAQLFAFPSLYEGFGLPALEAMASGTPIVCSSASSLPEVVGDSALLLEPRGELAWSEAMHELLSNRDLRKKLVRSGLERAKEFSWHQSVSKLLDVLEQAAK